jgi:O-antigen/teichoic acid export membrane protein
METLKEKTAKGLFWGGLGNFIQQLLNLIFGIFLARLLSQSDYGMVGMLTIFSQMAGTLQEGGFISALNRKKEISHTDYNAVFWTSTLLSLFFYIVLFFCAPLIADFYDTPELTSLARYIFIAFFITSLGIAPRAYMFRNMKVQQTAIVTISCLLISGIVGVIMAANGFAFWAIATQTIVYVTVITSLNFYFSKWRPSLSVDFSPIKVMIGYSSKLIVTNIFNVVNGNIFSVIFGRIYTPHEVGNYTQANKWNYMGASFISNMLWGVLQPVFAKTEDDIERQKRILRKMLRFTAFVSFPAMFGLSLVAKEFIVLLLGEKWIESAEMMQILCFAGAFSPICGIFSNLIISRGHSTTFMWCSISQCLVQLLALVVTAQHGIDAMIIVSSIINILWLLVWFQYSKAEIKITFLEVVKDISPYLIITSAIVFAAYLITSGIDNHFLSFMIKVVFTATVYLSVLWILQSNIIREVYLFIRKREITQ